MNPVLASSLEYGCAGATTYQHFAVFWLGPLLGHLCARKLHRRIMPASGTPPLVKEGAKEERSVASSKHQQQQRHDQRQRQVRHRQRT